jgi:hypothetical protein
VAVSTTVPGTHYVVFAASLDSTERGSVAIANVQLERVSSAGTPPSSYVSNAASALTVSFDCIAGSPRDLQSAFRYVCESPGPCFYELRSPLVIDTRGLATGESKLSGKLAGGNFNFRHIDVAVNLVGTGVLDCARDPSPACFGSAFVQYSLFHDAYDSIVTDHQNVDRHFDFGSAAINQGKGLASERFITLPIGSADEALLNQPQIRKPEFRGRPLSGTYRFRVFDKPSLVWANLEDIQFVLTYRYWSRVQRQPPKE